jgi:uncharacterized membrane protein
MASMSFLKLSLSILRSYRASRLVVFLIAFLVIGGWLLATPEGLLGKADAIGYAVCHRIDLRSFHLGDRPLPLCSRCTGMYLGSITALLYLFIIRPRASFFPPRPLWIPLGIFVLCYIVDGFNSYWNLISGSKLLYLPNNSLRLVTGTFFGIALANLVYPGFNQSVWRSPKAEPALRSWGEMGLLLLLGTGVILAMETENPLILYPLALVSALGVVLLLTLVYTMVLLILFRREAMASTWKEMVLPFLGGLTLSFLQIGIIDLGRYLMMGTWEGFRF